MPKEEKIAPKIKALSDEMVHISTGSESIHKGPGHPMLRVNRTVGQKASDWLAKWVGSWTFIILITIVLIIWISANTSWLLFGRGWDPYPFILLNFVLSTLAAIQAPIILMSQNRTSQKDRARAEYDYAVNKKSEKEIRQIQIQLKKIEKHFSKKR